MWQIIFYTVLLVGIAILLLGIRVFFVKGGKFPNSHVEGNNALKDIGICCAARQDNLARNKQFKFYFWYEANLTDQQPYFGDCRNSALCIVFQQRH